MVELLPIHGQAGTWYHCNAKVDIPFYYPDLSALVISKLRKEYGHT